MSGLEASDLREEEVERLRPHVYERLAAEAQETIFMKIHDAHTHTQDGRPLIPPAITAGAIYLLRNPLDVAVSLAHHQGCSIEQAISDMADPASALDSSPNGLSNQLCQKLLTWSAHVQSWVDAPIRLHVMRYEDMTQRPLKTFTAAARFCGLPDDRERIERALRHSDFAELQRQERARSFREKSPKTQQFFRRGRVGTWRESLTETQVHRIVRDHGAVMARFGYLNVAGHPCV